MSFHLPADISTEISKNCCVALSRKAPKEKVTNERFWPLFREWFISSLSAYALEYNFAELMNMTSVENPQQNVGTILDYGIDLYFDSSIIDSFRKTDGCDRFATMNRELCGANGYERVAMFEEFFTNFQNYSWQKLIDEIRILSYFQPSFAEYAGVICCTKIPRDELSNFLRILNCYTKTEGVFNLHSIDALDVRREVEHFVREKKPKAMPAKTEETFIVEKTRKDGNFKYGKAKGKGKNRKLMTCTRCHKKGHMVKDCWSAEANCIVENSGEYNFEEINIMEKCNASQQNKREFILDSGSTIHVVSDLKLLENIKEVKTIVKTVNGFSASSYSGDLKLANNLMLKNVVFIEAAPRNIISAARLTKQDGVTISIDEKGCKIYKDKKFIASGTQKQGLYILNNLSNFAGVYQVEDVKKWHLAKGHASISQMKREYNRSKKSKVDEKVFHKVLKNCVSCSGRQC